MPTRREAAERKRDLLLYGAERYRAAFERDLTMIADREGWPNAIVTPLLKFFRDESTPAYWIALKEKHAAAFAKLQEDVMAGLAPPEALVEFRGEAETQLAQFAALEAAKAR